ncbi:MAG: ATP-grasp domain-containing protein [Vicingaceae bacterium]|jgi:carbamoyl-phosphate synthase large subunit|nr:ATP-grasp domain-containing protein [Flavobacteriales bacterium]MDF1676265.1 ATP-grasp domain-containing protein [Vicingaceae bacterium]|tara:strand:+ start:299 stop:1348 length:1050 start_codon:yes stop_codon:yes gene_type:complete
MSKPKYTVAVTGLNAIDSPGPGIAVIRALRESESFDVRIIGLSYESLEPGIYMHDLVDKTYQVPYPNAGQQVLFERFDYINSKENIDFLFPNFDAELFNFISLQTRLDEELGIKMVLPTQEQFDARHKANLYEYGKEHGIKVPFAKMVFSTAEIPSIANEIGFPLVVKGKFYDAKIAYSTDEAMQHFNKISAQWGLPVLVQEFIHGSEVNVCGIGDGNGVTLGAVPMRKLYITDKGKAWAGVSLDDEKLLDVTQKLVKATKWRGPFELEFMKTNEDEYNLIEINPRFPAWCYLTVGAGQNQVESLVNMAMGNKMKPFTTYDVGKMFIRYSYDMVVNMKEFEQISTIGEL